MARFERLGRRYVWTDAFAVMNEVALARATGDGRHEATAAGLVERVHRTLGRHRGDDGRVGWISGLGEAEGSLHPTRGGLRIGKPLPERGPWEPDDAELEWERDGQYFHYLTKWMQALDVLARSSGGRRYQRWASELAIAAHDGFTYVAPSGARRMFWKMSIDLQRPLVRSMGQHDPLDGLVTFVQLADTARALGGRTEAAPIEERAASFAAMLDGVDLATSDPLGIGGLLVDASRVDRLLERGAFRAFGDGELLEALLEAAFVGLAAFDRDGDLEAPAERRLAFRELGLSIGLAGLEAIRARLSRRSATAAALLRALEPFAPVRSRIEAFWLSPERRRTDGWRAHRDINDVMLATSLAPRGCLEVEAISRSAW